MFNTKEIAKLIKKEKSKGKIFWQQKENLHYITNSHWAIKLEFIPHDIEMALFSLGLKEANQAYNHKSISDNVPNIASILDGYQDKEKATLTQFQYITKDKMVLRLAKCEELTIPINQTYMNALDEYQEYKMSSSSKNLSPVIFENGNNALLILPIRAKEDIPKVI